MLQENITHPLAAENNECGSQEPCEKHKEYCATHSGKETQPVRHTSAGWKTADW